MIEKDRVPHWHPRGRNGARDEVVAGIVARVLTEAPGTDAGAIERAVRATFEDWRFDYQDPTPTSLPTQAHDDLAKAYEANPHLYIVASAPERPQSGAERAAHDLYRRRMWDDVAFERWAHDEADLPPGSTGPGRDDPPIWQCEVVDRLVLMTAQRSWWCTGDNRWVRVEDMEPSHRRHLLAAFRKRKRTLHTAAITRTLSTIDVDPSDGIAGMAARVMSEGVDEWLERQPLVARLVELGDSAPVSA